MRNVLVRSGAFISALALFSACSGGSDPVSPPVTISVSPASATVNAGATETFTATLTNASDNGVIWSASGGVINGSGTAATWTAPNSGGPYLIIAKSSQDQNKADTATVTVRQVSISISPTTASVNAGANAEFTATVANSSNGAVTWTSTGGSVTGSGSSIVWNSPLDAGSYTVTATSVADPSKSASATVTVAPIVVALTPTSATVPFGGSQQFSVAVTGAASNEVTWSTTGGTISGTGANVTWNAPANAGSYEVRATSTLNPEVRAVATITVTPIQISLSPSTVSLFRGEPTVFTATVTGSTAEHSGVSWSATCGSGNANGSSYNYTAPVTAGSCVVKATSTTDAAKFAEATVTVNQNLRVGSLADTDDGVCNFAHCTLREAINAANAAPDSSIIVISEASLNVLGAAGFRGNRLADGAALNLTNALPEITTPMAIIGPGSDVLTLNVGGGPGTDRRAFTVTGGKLSLSGISITGGLHTSGGAILVQSGGSLAVSNSRFHQNEARTGDGGAIRLFGGSIASFTNVTFDNNRAPGPSGFGGALMVESSSATLEGGSFTNNSSGGLSGGAVAGIAASITANNVDFLDNVGNQSGGAIGMWNGGTLGITGGKIERNEANVGAGVFAGASTLTDGVRVYVQIKNTTISDNIAGNQGGGIQLVRNVEVDIENVTLSKNKLRESSGVYATGGAGMLMGTRVSATITSSTISDNEVLSAVHSRSDDGGAGIHVTYEGIRAYTPSLFLRNSTLSGNKALIPGGALAVLTGNVVVENSTISGNSAPTGGAIFSQDTLTIVNSTIVKNSASVLHGGLLVQNGHTRLVNTLFASNSAGASGTNCGFTGGLLESLGHNLSNDASCAALVHANDKNNTPAGINETLADNGGTTLTHALLTGSAAINAGSGERCPIADQRGFARVGACDIGAFEFGATSSSFNGIKAYDSFTRRAAAMPATRYPLGQKAKATSPSSTVGTGSVMVRPRQ